MNIYISIQTEMLDTQVNDSLVVLLTEHAWEKSLQQQEEIQLMKEFHENTTSKA